MSAAFDTINRRHLLDIVKSQTNTVPSEWHSHSHKDKLYFYIKTIHKQCRHPTGRQLKPGSIYYRFRTCSQRPTLPRPTTSFEEEIPNEVAYADDVDFIGQNYADIKKIQEVLKKCQLKVNTDKTEYTSIKKKRRRVERSKKSRITYR